MARAFISHSTRDDESALALGAVLEADGLEVWNDAEDIRAGLLLGAQLQGAIRAADTLVLLWSHHSASSRWVQSEWLTALLMGKFVLPVLLDDTSLPFCFQNSVAVDMKVTGPGKPDDVVRHVRAGQGRRTSLAPVMRSQDPALREHLAALTRGQLAVTAALQRRDLDAASSTQMELDCVMRQIDTQFPLHLDVLNVGAYHRKNRYMIEHWDAIQAGRAPKDSLMEEAERRFFETLSVDPTYPDALNGIGNVFFYERELDAAMFFARAAIACALIHGYESYESAEHDLALYTRFKARAERDEQGRPIVGE